MHIALFKNISKIIFIFTILYFLNTQKVLCNISENQNITITVKELSTKDFIELFDSYNPVKIIKLSKKYKALEITVLNRTKQDYIFDPKNISLPIESRLILKNKAKTNPFLLPIFTSVASIALMIAGAGLAFVPSVIAGTALGITTLNLNMQKSNKISTKNIYTKMLDTKHPQLISCFSSVKKIVFIKKNKIHNKFSITLKTSHENNQKIFNLNI